MKKSFYILFVLLAVLFNACKDDPLADLENTDWQKERNIVSILLEGQIGTAVIERTADEAKITAFVKEANIVDMSKVEIVAIELAYGATTVNAAGTTLDLTSGSATISVESGSGSTLDWEINTQPFVSDLEGEWYMQNIGLYCDMFTWESWGWEEYLNMTDYLSSSYAEMDNVLTFIVDGADANGNPFGTYVHAAGEDGVYADFTDLDNGWDFNDRFRKIPTGEGTWLRDFERNKVVITDANGQITELDLEINEETGDVTLKAELPYLADQFNWDNTNWSYEKLAHMSNPMWYTLTSEKVVQTGNAISAFAVVDQVGDAQIDAENKTVHVVIADNGANLAAIELTTLDVSFGATADVEVGAMLDFSDNMSTQIVVTSESGDDATWTITVQVEVDPNDVTIAGTWTINEMAVYCDLFTWEDWGWEKTELLNNYMSGAGAELDNTITFTVEGMNEFEEPYGNFENNAGADAAFANFVSDDAAWPETDFNNRFRQVPMGAGTWVKDGETIIITDSENNEFVLGLEVNTEDEIAITKEIEFLPDLFDWDVQNYSYEEVAHMSKKMWYKLVRN
jgi:hypothetical protein